MSRTQHVLRKTPLQEKSSIFFHPFLLLITILLTLIISVSLIKSIIALREKRKILQEKQSEIRQLEQENRDIQQEIEKRNSDFYKEQVIRDELNMQKEGETVIQLPGDKK